MWAPLTCLLLLIASVFGDERVTYPVEGRLVLPNRQAPPPTKISLNGGEHETISRADGSFTFHDVHPGIYLLDVLSSEAMFSQIKLSLPEDPTSPIRSLEYKFPGAPKQSIKYPVDLIAHAKVNYFEVREKIGLHTFMGNPMFYMVLFALFVIIVFPKMMENMDPEQLKEMQDMQNQMASAQQNPFQLMTQLMNPDAAPPAATKSSQVAAPAARSKKQR